METPSTTVTYNSRIVVDLKVDKKTLSSYKRQRTSASDDRLSSRVIGIIGATVVISVALLIVILDIFPFKVWKSE